MYNLKERSALKQLLFGRFGARDPDHAREHGAMSDALHVDERPGQRLMPATIYGRQP